MTALRAFRTQAATTSARSVAVPRLPCSGAPRRSFRVCATENERPGSFTNVIERETHRVNDGIVPKSISSSPKTHEQLFNPTTESINGRAAMLGFMAAVTTEAWTHQSVWHQIHGKFNGLQLVESPSGLAIISFGMVVIFVTLSSMIPKKLFGLNARDWQRGPFTETAEVWNGRAAQVGFLALLLTEWVKGTALFG